MEKKFCLECGAEITYSLSSQRKFCCKKCGDKYRRTAPKTRTIADSFELFKNIVAASDTPKEFRAYWRKYFKP